MTAPTPDLPDPTSSTRPHATSASDVVDRFRNSKEAMRTFEAWKVKPLRAGVPDLVLPMMTSAVYRVSTKDIDKLDSDILKNFTRLKAQNLPFDLTHSLHPLGDVRYKDIHPKKHWMFKMIADWSPPAAFMHLLHSILETRRGELFTYPEFREDLKHSELLGDLIIPSAELLFNRLDGRGKVPTLLLNQAFHWRVGIAYYSFLREIYVLAYFRQKGLILQTHPLADCLFRTDFWAEPADCISPFAIELYMKNDVYKSKKSGRKIPMEEFTRETFGEIYQIELTDTPEMGHLYVPSRETLDGHLKAIAKRGLWAPPKGF